MATLSNKIPPLSTYRHDIRLDPEFKAPHFLCAQDCIAQAFSPVQTEHIFKH